MRTLSKHWRFIKIYEMREEMRVPNAAFWFASKQKMGPEHRSGFC